MRNLLTVLSLLCSIPVAVAQGQPPKGYDCTHMTGTIYLDRATTSLSGQVTMTGVVTTAVPITRILQHLKFLEIDSVFVSGVRATYEVIDSVAGAYHVLVPESLQVAGYFTVTTYYHGNPKPEQNAAKWGGVTNRDSMMFAMGVGFATPYVSTTRHWLPCYDLPDDKIDSSDITFVTKRGEVVAASGRLVLSYVQGAYGGFRWRTEAPIATYLMTFATGPYRKGYIKGPPRIPFELYALERDYARAATLMERRAVPALVYFDSLFRPYPFEKVGYVVTPIGSMEHQTMISLDKRTLDTNNTTAVHELAHMWWGDHVTCETFDDPWLNEGFATFSEALFLERFNGRQAYLDRMHKYIRSAKKDGSHIPMYGAPAATGHTNNYPGPVIYDKGAAVLGMLREYAGDSLFFKTLRLYSDRHAFSTATSFDLWAAFEEVLGEDMDWFFQRWVFQTGYPHYSIRWKQEGSETVFTLTQWVDSLLFQSSIPAVVRAQDGSIVNFRLVADSARTTTVRHTFGFQPVEVRIDPDSLMIMTYDLAAAEVRSAPRTTGGLVVYALSDSNLRVEWPQALERASAWRLTDIQGKILAEGRIPNGAMRVDIPAGSLGSAATYFVSVIDGHSIMATTSYIHLGR